MVVVKENGPLLERSQDIIRRLDKADVPDDERATLEAEQEELQRKMEEHLAFYIKKNQEKLRNERPSFVGKSKNDMKKILADYFKDIMKDLDKNTQKGVFRQGYKSLK